MALYRRTAGGVIRTTDNVFIPSDSDNKDYAAFLKWQAQGNTPDPIIVLEKTRDEIDRDAARVYDKLVALRAMTPAQVQVYIDANVNNLSQAKEAIKTLAVAVSILARQI